MTYKELFKYINDNNRMDTTVAVGKTTYYDGDHECEETDIISIFENGDKTAIYGKF